MKDFKVVVKFELPIEIKKKGKIFVARCPAFDVWTQGDSIDKAEKNIVEALELFLQAYVGRTKIKNP